MRPVELAGTFADKHGVTPCVWTIKDSSLPGWAGRYEIRATVRGVPVWGCDFDGIEREGRDDQDDTLELNAAGELRGLLTGTWKCTVDGPDGPSVGTLTFRLDLTAPPKYIPGEPKHLQLTLAVGETEYSAAGDEFETALEGLKRCLPSHTRIRCCWSCNLSDYSPDGTGLMGMRCHRDARDQYLAVRSKLDYRSVPITEDVPEIYLCDAYEPRVPGTGYRG